MLLAVLDSNAADGPVGLATGAVDNKELVALRSELAEVDAPYLARIAVVHHHVLPIAHTGGKVGGAEPLMVLKNAGTVLSVLTENRFDLVLHGHKHKPQFARLDLESKDANGRDAYPIAVAAAGSTSLITRNESRGNCFNLITIEDNGRIVVKSLFCGDGHIPDLADDEGTHVQVYREPLSAVKRRAYVRARERHNGVHSGQRTQAFEVTETGDLRVEHTVQDLWIRGDTQSPATRRYRVSFPSYGRFCESELKLADRSIAKGYRLIRFPASQGKAAGAGTSAREFSVEIPRDEASGGSAGYAVRYGFANSIVMTRWEACERARANARARARGPEDRDEDWDQEWVGINVQHPAERITLSLKLPDSLVEVQPYLRCRRHPEFPAYEIDDQGDASVSAVADFVDDSSMAEDEGTQLRYVPSQGTWEITIDKPMVGYSYQLRWRLPGEEPDHEVGGQTVERQEMLLEMATRRAKGQPKGVDREAERIFGILSASLEKLLGSGAANEKRSVELWAYDSGALVLRPVLSHRSWSPTPLSSDFAIPLGDGIAGAAFQQRRIVPWAEAHSPSPFIQPVNYPATNGDGMVLRAVLAVPVVHPDWKSEARPPPWLAIGVVSFGSSSPAAKATSLCRRDLNEAGRNRVKEVRAFVQTHVEAILDALHGGGSA